MSGNKPIHYSFKTTRHVHPVGEASPSPNEVDYFLSVTRYQSLELEEWIFLSDSHRGKNVTQGQFNEDTQ